MCDLIKDYNKLIKKNTEVIFGLCCLTCSQLETGEDSDMVTHMN